MIDAGLLLTAATNCPSLRPVRQLVEELLPYLALRQEIDLLHLAQYRATRELPALDADVGW